MAATSSLTGSDSGSKLLLSVAMLVTVLTWPSPNRLRFAALGSCCQCRCCCLLLFILGKCFHSQFQDGSTFLDYHNLLIFGSKLAIVLGSSCRWCKLRIILILFRSSPRIILLLRAVTSRVSFFCRNYSTTRLHRTRSVSREHQLEDSHLLGPYHYAFQTYQTIADRSPPRRSPAVRSFEALGLSKSLNLNVMILPIDKLLEIIRIRQPQFPCCMHVWIHRFLLIFIGTLTNKIKPLVIILERPDAMLVRFSWNHNLHLLPQIGYDLH